MAAIALIGIAILIAALLQKRRADDFEAKQTQTPNSNVASSSQTPSTPDQASVDPHSSASPNEPSEKNPNTEAVVALNDEGRVINVDANGNVSGLDDVPASTRDEIAQVLLTERIARPRIVKELGGEDNTLRGNDNRQSFKLNSPARTVLISDRPTFKWDKLSGASSYRVYVNDREGNSVETSEVLSSERTEWHVTKPLKRGQIYVWTVVAVVDGKEVVSPGPSLPEVKFQVLSASSLRRLNELKKTRSHLVLGIFYANAGLTSEAQQEFRELVRLNPKSKIAINLLKAVSNRG